MEGDLLIKEALLGLLASQPMHGYELKVELDRVLGRTTPMNVGQIYTALNKLEKDGLVCTEFVPRTDQREMKVYSLSPTGAVHLHRWFTEPVEKVDLRDELFIKLSLARRTGPARCGPILQAQRLTTLRSIQELTILKERLDTVADEEVALLIEGAILHQEADLRWLELWEQRLLNGRV
jgi:DNA-binding PadR family transcriptional regulator